MKVRAGLVVAVVAIVVVIWSRRASDPDPPPAPHASTESVVPARQRPASGQPPPAPPTRVTRLASAAEREQVADWIAAAHAARAQRWAAARAGSAIGAPPPVPNDLEHAPAKLQAALGEAIPILAECYKTGAKLERRPAVQMTLIGDPDVGTLINADQLLAPDGTPLEPELESCLRTTLASMELPPLGGTEPLRIEYSFRFDDDD